MASAPDNQIWTEAAASLAIIAYHHNARRYSFRFDRPVPGKISADVLLSPNTHARISGLSSRTHDLAPLLSLLRHG